MASNQSSSFPSRSWALTLAENQKRWQQDVNCGQLSRKRYDQLVRIHKTMPRTIMLARKLYTEVPATEFCTGEILKDLQKWHSSTLSEKTKKEIATTLLSCIWLRDVEPEEVDEATMEDVGIALESMYWLYACPTKIANFRTMQGTETVLLIDTCLVAQVEGARVVGLVPLDEELAEIQKQFSDLEDEEVKLEDSNENQGIRYRFYFCNEPATELDFWNQMAEVFMHYP